MKGAHIARQEIVNDSQRAWAVQKERGWDAGLGGLVAKFAPAPSASVPERDRCTARLKAALDKAEQAKVKA